MIAWHHLGDLRSICEGIWQAGLMVSMSLRERDRLRRETVERYHRLKDAEEEFDLASAAAASPLERERLMNEFAEFRRRHREEDMLRGKRPPGFAIQMHQIMWARWIEITAAHELAARAAYDEICAGQTAKLTEELRQSLVAIAAAASTVEALYEDLKYLVPERPQYHSAAERVSDGLSTAFGLPQDTSTALLKELMWLFDRRNEGLHAYAEPEAPQPHPSGVNSGAEASRFNGPESHKALRIALKVLQYAAGPPLPANRWVARWVEERRAYHQTVVVPIREAVCSSEAASMIIDG
jgi:hypothetical protein